MTSFILLGVLSIILLKLSYEDWQTKLVDVPVTLYASGFVSGAYILSGRFIEFFVWAIVFMFLWRFIKPFCEKNKLVGAGDISILSFLLPAAWFANVWLLSVFLALFGVVTLIWFRKQLLNKDLEKPLVPVITVAWIVTWIIGVLFF